MWSKELEEEIATDKFLMGEPFLFGDTHQKLSNRSFQLEVW